MKLINTIEISPLRYSREEAVSQLNFNFEAIEKGSYLTDIETINDENLKMIVEAKMEDTGPEESEEDVYVMAFDGGIVLKI